LRAAWSNSVVRPTFGQLAPGLAIDGDDAEFGNPNLAPLKSANLDANRDLYVDAQTQFDLSARYALSKALQIAFDVQNLNDAKYCVYTGSSQRNAQWASRTASSSAAGAKHGEWWCCVGASSTTLR
jgi:outer membrane receptor protein involved in Fe transport